MTKRRAKNLDDGAIELIVGLLDGWSGKLTWDLLIDAIEKRMRVRYTRQALDRHVRIKNAYEVAKGRINEIPRSEGERKRSSIEVVTLIQRLKRLEAENARLEMENERLLEQFVTWAYNAHLKGITKDFLNAPLPCIDREQTQRPEINAKGKVTMTGRSQTVHK